MPESYMKQLLHGVQDHSVVVNTTITLAGIFMLLNF